MATLAGVAGTGLDDSCAKAEGVHERGFCEKDELSGPGAEKEFLAEQSGTKAEQLKWPKVFWGRIGNVEMAWGFGELDGRNIEMAGLFWFGLDETQRCRDAEPRGRFFWKIFLL